MVKAEHPSGLLHGSAVSPTLAAAIINGKYVNAIPLYRLKQEFKRYGLAITRKNMANWMIRLREEYLKPYEYFEHLLTVIPEHMEDTDRSFLEELLPWSPALPENIRK